VQPCSPIAQGGEVMSLALVADAAKEGDTAMARDASRDPWLRGVPVPATIARAASTAAAVWSGPVMPGMNRPRTASPTNRSAIPSAMITALLATW
jgi:hypothetical protein